MELGQFPQAKVLRRNDWGWAISNGNVVCCSWAQGSEDFVLVLSQWVQRSFILLATFFLDQVGKLFFPANNFRPKQSKSHQITQKGVQKTRQFPLFFRFFLAALKFLSGSLDPEDLEQPGAVDLHPQLFCLDPWLERFPGKIWIGVFFSCEFSSFFRFFEYL